MHESNASFETVFAYTLLLHRRADDDGSWQVLYCMVGSPHSQHAQSSMTGPKYEVKDDLSNSCDRDELILGHVVVDRLWRHEGRLAYSRCIQLHFLPMHDLKVFE